MPNLMRPFDSGTQFADWTSSNCDRCNASCHEPGEWPTCEIESALVYAFFDEGAVSDDIAARMGINEETEGKYVWMCGEVDWADEWMKEHEEKAI